MSYEAMYKEYLKSYQPKKYKALKDEGTLQDHISQTAETMVEQLSARLREVQTKNSELPFAEQIQKANQARSQFEEQMFAEVMPMQDVAV